eukprot:GHVH01004666.1.p1 GENE.GHVH01004666.1~~GHVH01004666.1.p1  ORF type:complete len:558 (+),score=110.91 GHVH01004666.1:37-1710(+)
MAPSDCKKLKNRDRFEKVLNRDEGVQRTTVHPKSTHRPAAEVLESDDRFAMLKDDRFEKAKADRMTLARGETIFESSSDDEEEKKVKSSKFVWNAVSSSDDEEAAFEKDLDTWDPSAIPGDAQDDEDIDEITSRLALTGLMWDQVDAKDILVLFSSLSRTAQGLKMPSKDTPKRTLEALQETRDNGENYIIKVSVFQSRFGKERMSYEELHGPKIDYERFQAEMPEVGGEHLRSRNSEVNPSVLAAHRDYQLQKSKYFFAIIELSSPTIADCLHKSINGTDSPFSVFPIELMFVTNETTFEDFPLRDAAEKINPNYIAPEILRNALTQTGLAIPKFDNDDTRGKVLEKMFTDAEVDQMDVEKYMACSSSDDESDDLQKSGASKIGFKLPSFITEAPEPCENSSRNSSESDDSDILEKQAFFEHLKLRQKNNRAGIVTSRGASDSDDSTKSEAAEEVDDDPLCPVVEKSTEKRKKMSRKAKERVERRKKRKEKSTREEAAALDPDKVDAVLVDPRFSRLVDDPKRFAIDKQNPMFKNSKGDKVVVDQVRKRRRRNLEA